MSDALRREYYGEGLTESELAPTPWEQARGWVDDAVYRSRATSASAHGARGQARGPHGGRAGHRGSTRRPWRATSHA